MKIGFDMKIKKEKKSGLKIDKKKLKGVKKIKLVVSKKANTKFLPKNNKQDNINPNHYKGQIETFSYLADKLTKEELAGFCKGNIIKYITREKTKNGLEDIKKGQWYIEKLIDIKK